jgi:LysM repeat protein
MSIPFIRIVGFLIMVSMLLSPVGALAAPEAEGETIHVVQWGETLSIIADRYGVTVDAIMTANGLTDPNLIYVGQRLIIPTTGSSSQPCVEPPCGQGGRHVVAPGDTLTSIAFRYGTSVAMLAAANGLSDSDLIYIGQVLNIPGEPSMGPAPVSGECSAYYTVQGGDTLSGIAWRYQTTTNALMQANELYSDIIYQGQRLCVPAGGVARGPSVPGPTYNYYTVRPGDTLMAIAWRFGVSQASIMQSNNLSNPNFIYVGQRLLIPGVNAAPHPPGGPVPPAPRHRVAKIAFALWDGSKHDLYIANTDGSDEKLLLERAAGPSWSPDGQSLSFFGEEGVDRQLQDGTPVVFEGISNGILTVSLAHWPGDLQQLNMVQIQREGTARATTWSPNGKVIAWDARPGGNYRIYFHGEEGTDFEVQSAVEIMGEHPDWSPDGNQIVYRSGREGKQGIWISDRYDSVVNRITDDGSDAFPRWSPDGRQIAFQRETDGNVDIYVMNPDGSNVHRLTHASGHDALPAWTPDGQGIVFRSARTGSWGIYTMNADASDQRQIIPYADPGPDWTLGRIAVTPIH